MMPYCLKILELIKLLTDVRMSAVVRVLPSLGFCFLKMKLPIDTAVSELTIFDRNF